MRVGAVVVMLVVLVGAGCGKTNGILTSNTETATAIRWGNIGVALVECAQDAMAKPQAEAGVQACVTHWVPNADKVLASPAWSTTAACIRTAVKAAPPPGAERVKAIAQGVADCIQANMSALVSAAQAAGA